MPLPLPDLDTRKWTDLVDEGRSLIPLYAPTWTDHNVHDPGITLVELLAWLVELDIYRLNRVPDAHRRKFLSLVDMAPDPARVAHTWLGVAPPAATAVPAGTTFLVQPPNAAPVAFRATATTAAVPATLQSVFVQAAPDQPPLDQVSVLRTGASFAAFGDDPLPGSALWLAFDSALPTTSCVRLAFTLDGGRSGSDERTRIAAEPGFSIDQHHSVALTWEVSQPDGSWLALDPTIDQVGDSTRALTLDGGVVLCLPSAMGAINVGGRQHYVVRARLTSGAYDAPPIINSIVFNAAPLEQTIAPVQILQIQPNVQIQGTPPGGPDERALQLTLDAQGNVTSLAFLDGADLPSFSILAFVPPRADLPGTLVLEAVLLGRGSGLPRQSFPLPTGPLADGVIEIVSLEANRLQVWRVRPDFDASAPSDSHFVLDDVSQMVTFGDGNHGRLPGPGVALIARYAATQADSGNVAQGGSISLAPSLQNWARLDWGDLQQRLSTGGIQALSGDPAQMWQATNPAGFASAVAKLGTLHSPNAASGGQAAETLDHAVGRAVNTLQMPTRAITAADYEALALATPGTAIARARALPGQYTPYPCLSAPGVVSLVVVPDQSSARPMPSPGLLSSVRRYIGRRRVLGTHLEVVGPEFVQIQVRASIRASLGADTQTVTASVMTALNIFFDPFRGGLTGQGWPFGRPVYRAEVLQVIDRVVGVDTVLTLELSADGQPPQCGNVCIGATHLVVSGPHAIEVSSA